MPRVKKIKIGNTAYDIAHEGVLKNSGFEVVTSLPTTGLFEGREVIYKGIRYIYKNRTWINETNPISVGDVLQFSENGGFDQLWYMLHYGLLLSNNTNCVKEEDRLIEYIDNETGNVSIVNNFPPLYVGKTLRWTAFNPDRDGSLSARLHSNFSTSCKPFSLLISGNVRNSKCIYTVEYYKYTNATGDGDTNNRANFEWVSVFSKEMSFRTTFIALPRIFVINAISPYYIQNIRVSITPTTNDPNSYNYVEKIDVFYFAASHMSLLNANRLINYDAAIDPTQTGFEFKKLPWWMQYITQGVNWLKANKVALSVYNAKVAELEQADSANNAYIESVKEELSNAIYPWYVSYNGVDYPARLQGNWLQIYRNEVWANLLYLASKEPIQPTDVVQITSFGNLDWYNEQVSEYEIDSNTTFELLDGKVFIAGQLIDCTANQLTLNLYPIPYGRYSKGALDNVISDFKDNNFAVFVENDIDTILTSGNDFCVRIKISKVPTYKAIIECYVAR